MNRRPHDQDQGADADALLVEFWKTCWRLRREGVELSADGKELVLPDGKSIAVASASWGEFLKAIDGMQTVGDIIYNLGLPKSRTIRQLRSSMEDGVIIAAHV